MICDTRMLKIAYYSMLLNSNSTSSNIVQSIGTAFIVVSRSRKRKAKRQRKEEKIKLIFLSRFRENEKRVSDVEATKGRIESLGFSFAC